MILNFKPHSPTATVILTVATLAVGAQAFVAPFAHHEGDFHDHQRPIPVHSINVAVSGSTTSSVTFNSSGFFANSAPLAYVENTILEAGYNAAQVRDYRPAIVIYPRDKA